MSQVPLKGFLQKGIYKGPFKEPSNVPQGFL